MPSPDDPILTPSAQKIWDDNVPKLHKNGEDVVAIPAPPLPDGPVTINTPFTVQEIWLDVDEVQWTGYYWMRPIGADITQIGEIVYVAIYKGKGTVRDIGDPKGKPLEEFKKCRFQQVKRPDGLVAIQLADIDAFEKESKEKNHEVNG